jgi:hypothetical protein
MVSEWFDVGVGMTTEEEEGVMIAAVPAAVPAAAAPASPPRDLRPAASKPALVLVLPAAFVPNRAARHVDADVFGGAALGIRLPHFRSAWWRRVADGVHGERWMMNGG